MEGALPREQKDNGKIPIKEMSPNTTFKAYSYHTPLPWYYLVLVPAVALLFMCFAVVHWAIGGKVEPEDEL